MNCPRCGQAVKPGAQFCAQCGASMPAAPPAPAPDQEWTPLPVESRGDAGARKLLVGCALAVVLIAIAVVGGAALLAFVTR